MLAERLAQRGAPASVARPVTTEDPLGEMLLYEYGPLCEILLLAMAADGKIEQAEQDIIRGALRELDDRIRTAHFGAMLRRAEELLAAEGPERRLAAAAQALADDPVRGEVSYVLASAIVYSDDDLSMAENTFLNDLAEALGIDDARSEQLQRLLLG